MFRATLAALVTTATVAATPVSAATLTDSYSGFLVFGDSLSDNGNLFAQSGGAVPGAPYVAGRFSNGPVWNDPLIAAFAAKGQAAVNLAFGGARARTNADAAPDFAAQIAIFDAQGLSALFGDTALVSVFFGGNDLRDTLSAAATAFLGGAGPSDVAAIVVAGATSAAVAVGAGIEALADRNLATFAVWNAPNLGVVPEVTALGPQAAGLATQASLAFNAALAAELGRIAAQRPALDLTTVDLFATITAAVLDPAAVGLSDVTTPCLSVTFAICNAPDTTLFWDTIHPTAAGHALLTAAFRDAVPVVPLPAPALLLVAGLGALAVLRRRA
ncbi:MAG: SGNH/GDSL hydrolase family protein [Rhodobacteraceae bacterium]|jgi:outer membrane lipase/esterase|nr:SGNH/GDSL hydrolase family protein [Paracoccaceae bacterium]